jgi:hypothetical protein
VSRHLLTILPGASRTQDRIVHNERVEIRLYDPAKDKNLTPEQAKGRLATIRVSEGGGPEQEFAFVMPCYFWGECDSIEDLAAELGENIKVGEPVKDSDEIGRSGLRSWIALGDGSVYTWCKPSGYNVTFANKWPIQVDPKLVSELKDQQLAERFISLARHIGARDSD